MGTILHQKEEQYRGYVQNHINNIQQAWARLQDKFPDELFVKDHELNQAISNAIIHHDESKYSDEEFNAYRKFFYPVTSTEKNKEEFAKAFKHHIQVNEHHWEHWVDSEGNPIDRKEKRIQTLVEMMCDWIAMGMTFGNNAEEYLVSNKKKIKLIDEDYYFVIRILHSFYS